MLKLNDTVIVALYNILLLLLFVLLMYNLKEWWLLFMFLGLASNKDKEENNDK